MNDLLLVLAWCAGSLLGALFFGGLWWTTRRGVMAKEPLWFLGSLLVRTTVTLIGFYVVGNGHWQRLLACLVGFVMAQAVVTWLTRTKGGRRRAS